MSEAAEDRSNSLLAQVDRGVLGLIQELFRSAARCTRVRMVNRLNTDLPVRYGTVEIASMGRVLDRLESQDGGAFCTLRMLPSGVPGIIVIQGPLLYRLVGIMLGENEDRDPSLYHWRPLTSLDLKIATRIASDVALGLLDACTMPEIPEMTLESVTGNPRVRMNLSRGTTVVEATLDFGPPEQPFGLVSIVLPGQCSGILWPSRLQRNATPQTAPDEGMERVMPVPIEAVAELARIQMPWSRVRALEVGSLLELGNLRDVEVRIGGRPALIAEPGERDGCRSVRVKSRLLPKGEGPEAR